MWTAGKSSGCIAGGEPKRGMGRSTGSQRDEIGMTVVPQVQEDDDGLTEEDWDVVCQFFWLPHSHGPMVERLLEDFRSCLFNMKIEKSGNQNQQGCQCQKSSV